MLTIFRYCLKKWNIETKTQDVSPRDYFKTSPNFFISMVLTKDLEFYCKFILCETSNFTVAVIFVLRCNRLYPEGVDVSPNVILLIRNRKPFWGVQLQH